MSFYNVRKLPDGRLYVIMSVTPSDDGVYADSVFFVNPGDPDYDELEKDAKAVIVMPDE